MIIVRDGSSGFCFVGECALPEQEIINTRCAGGMIQLKNARIMQTFSMAVGPGAIAQDTHVFPIDHELGPIDPWVFPTSFYYPSEEAQKRIRALIKRCEDNEVKLRAKESGLTV